MITEQKVNSAARIIRVGMNVFVQELARREYKSSGDRSWPDIVVEDNVGEGIHVHFWSVRLEISIVDFKKMVEEFDSAARELERWE